MTSKSGRTLIGQLIEQQRAAHAGPPLVPVPHTEPLPLLVGQQLFWRPPGASGSPAMVYFVFSLDGPLDLDVLNRTSTEILTRHEALRTVFPAIDGVSAQVIKPPWAMKLPLEDLVVPDGSRLEDVLRLSVERALALSYDQHLGPVGRGFVMRLSPVRHLLMVVNDHIMMDGFSIALFMAELGVIYAAFAAGKPSPLPPLPVQVADVAIWQRRRHSDDVLTAERDFWRKRLGDAPRGVALPFDRPRDGRNTPAQLVLEIDERMTTMLRSATLEGGLLSTLWTAFIAMLHETSGQDDLVVGSFHMNRDHAAMRTLIGCFTTMVPVRTRVQRGESIKELRVRVQQDLIETFDHLALTHSQVIEAVEPAPKPGSPPLFNIVFHVFPWGQPVAAPKADVHITPLLLWPLPRKVDLTVAVYMKQTTTEIAMDYNAALFDRSTIQHLADRFAAHLESLLHDGS